MNPFDLRVGDGHWELVVVGELEEQDLQHASESCSVGVRQRLQESPQRRRAVLTRMLIEAPADSEEIEEIQANRVGDGFLHGLACHHTRAPRHANDPRA